MTLKLSMFLPLGNRPRVSVVFHTRLRYGSLACIINLLVVFRHHLDYLFHGRMNRNVSVDGTVAMFTGCLNLAVQEVCLHHVSDMAGG